MHFMVHSSIKYWSGDLTWSLTNANNPFSAKCADMTISSFYAVNNTATFYSIICPYEGDISTTGRTMVGVTPTLKVASWTWPDYYG